MSESRDTTADDSRAHDESGAIAIMTALMSVALLLVGAFSIDLGMAYTSRMALQTAADAGALAAATTYAEAPGRSCADLLAAVPEATAREVAEKYLTANQSTMSTNSSGTFSATCTDGRLRVGFTVRADTTVVLGRLAQAGDVLRASASAAASVEVSPGGTGIRPLAICAAELPADLTPGTVWRAYVPGQGPTPAPSCPLPPTPGNWWTLDCPTESGGTSELELQIRNGCSDPIAVGDLMSGDPGQPDSGQQPDAWASLINAGTTFGLPVAVPTSGSGTHADFPVQRIQAVSVCGYHFGKQLKKRYAPGINACAPASQAAAALMADEADTSYLLLVARTRFVSGGTAEHPCLLGDSTCDGGLRRVRLVE